MKLLPVFCRLFLKRHKGEKSFMNESAKINPTLIQRLLESDISSQEIAIHTGINQQVVNSYRKLSHEEKPLVHMKNMRLKVAHSLTKEAKRQKIRMHDTVFYTKEEIAEALHHQIHCLHEFEKKTGIDKFTLNLAKRYSKDEKCFGLIRLGVVMKMMDFINEA